MNQSISPWVAGSWRSLYPLSAGRGTLRRNEASPHGLGRRVSHGKNLYDGQLIFYGFTEIGKAGQD